MTTTNPDGLPELPDGAKTPYKPPYASVLGTRCAELARAISYHDPEPVGAIKHTLREAAYFIDSQCSFVGSHCLSHGAASLSACASKSARAADSTSSPRCWVRAAVMARRA